MKNKNYFTILGASLFAVTLSGCSLGGLINGGNITGSDSLPKTAEEAAAEVEKMSKNGGFEVTLRYDTDDTESSESYEVSMGKKDNISWQFDQEGNGTAVVGETEYCDLYEYSASSNAWTYDKRVQKDNYDAAKTFDTAYFGVLYLGHELDGEYKKDGTTSVCGRTCDVYKYAMNVVVVKLSYTIAVDRETGLTLKYQISGATTADKGGESFEATSFKTSGVTAPVLPEPVVAE